MNQEMRVECTWMVRVKIESNKTGNYGKAYEESK